MTEKDLFALQDKLSTGNSILYEIRDLEEQLDFLAKFSDESLIGVGITALPRVRIPAKAIKPAAVLYLKEALKLCQKKLEAL